MTSAITYNDGRDEMIAMMRHRVRATVATYPKQTAAIPARDAALRRIVVESFVANVAVTRNNAMSISTTPKAYAIGMTVLFDTRSPALDQS